MLRAWPSGFLERLAAFYAILANVRNRRGVLFMGCRPTKKGLHLSPQGAPLLPFLGRQLFESARLAQNRQVGIGLPVPHQSLDFGFEPITALFECLAPPSEVLAEPVEGLPPPHGTPLVVQLVRVLALTATRLGRGAGSVIACERQHI